MPKAVLAYWRCIRCLGPANSVPLWRGLREGLERPDPRWPFMPVCPHCAEAPLREDEVELCGAVWDLPPELWVFSPGAGLRRAGD